MITENRVLNCSNTTEGDSGVDDTWEDDEVTNQLSLIPTFMNRPRKM
jgi:hypothetical protein